MLSSSGAIAAIYLHKPSHLFESPTLYLSTAIGLLILSGAVRCGLVLYRNVRYGKSIAGASVRTIVFKNAGGISSGIPSGQPVSLSDAVHVHVRLPRPWTPRAGQYIYLSIPGASRTSVAQQHPFYIAWWYIKNGTYYVVLLVQKHRGFTERMFLHRVDEREVNMKAGPGSSQVEMAAVVDGPYGRELNLNSYGTVLLFATGIGIAGQLPYVKQLLDGYKNCEVRTRRIALFWQVDSESKLAPTSTRTGSH
jgi:hypothetical protein